SLDGGGDDVRIGVALEGLTGADADDGGGVVGLLALFGDTHHGHATCQSGGDRSEAGVGHDGVGVGYNGGVGHIPGDDHVDRNGEVAAVDVRRQGDKAPHRQCGDGVEDPLYDRR